MNRLIQGALILTFAGIISKVLSAFYRIPIQNLTGDIGFYLYQQIYPFIATVMILTLYSFPAAVSQMGATLGQKRHDLRYFILPNIFLLWLINGGIGLLLFILAPHLARLAGEAHLLTAYRLVAISFLFIPVIALIRGIFQAEEDMQPTAISQLIEQLFRVLIIIIVAYLIFAGRLTVHYIAVYGVGATIIGMFIASIYLSFTYVRYRRRQVLLEPMRNEKIPFSFYIHTLLVFGFAVAMNHMIFIIIQLADVISIVPLLEMTGISGAEAMDQKGIFDRAVPLIQLGMVVGSSFALAFIPFLANGGGKPNQRKKVMQDAMAITVYIATGATIGLFILFPEANKLLFNDREGITSMRIFILSIGLLAIIMTIQAILQSYGERIRTAIYIGSIFFVKILLNVLLVPIFGMNGAAIAAIISLLILYSITMYRLQKKFTHLQLFAGVHWRALAVASLMMIIVLASITHFMTMDFTRTGLLVYVALLIISGASIYFLILLRFGALTKEQLLALPFSSKWLLLQELVSKNKGKDD